MHETNDKPNIFSYATKELSQDAVICWLIEWSSFDGQGHEKLRECGQQFVKALFAKHDKKVPENCGKPEIWRQDNNIDVLAKIGEYVLLIEDKTDTGEHSGQLERYYKLVKNSETQAGDVDEANILPIYLKTGNQPLFDRLRIENLTPHSYKVFDRCDLLEVVEPYQGTHPILDDFRDHLKSLEDDTQSYKKWGKESYRSWEGFFRELENHLVVFDRDNCKVGFGNESPSIKDSLINDPFGSWWGWVNNPTGGFYCFSWYSKTVKSCGHDVELYLQLEIKLSEPDERKLCFKVGMEKDYKDKWVEIKWDCHERILKAAGEKLVREPKRMGHGHTVTIAEWINPWLIFNSNDGPDIQKTVKNLMEAQSVLKRVKEII